MFNNMKNKIREKTGSDLPKLSLAQKTGLGRHSRQGSDTSLSSLVLEPPLSKEETPVQTPTSITAEMTLADGKSLTSKELTKLAKREDEWRSRLEKRDTEWSKKLDKKELELTKMMEEKEKDWRKQEQSMTEDLLKLTRELKEALRVAEESKRKICQYQEDKDQLEGFQMQEIAKIKHLLLAKEQENAENAAALKESLSAIDTLKAEVNRLRPFEEQISNFQDDIECLRHTSERERWQLSSKLAQSEETVRHLKERVDVLTRRSEAECVALGASLSPDERVQALLAERALLERKLEESHLHLSDIKASWSSKIASLETQVGRLSRQAGEEGSERRHAEERIAELEAHIDEDNKESERLLLRLERVCAERDTLAQELKNIAQDVAVAKSESMDLATRVVAAERQYADIQAECERLQQELDKERDRSKESGKEENELISQLTAELDRCRSVINEEKKHYEELKSAVDKERREKDEALLRNAQVSQDVEIVRQELRVQQQDSEELFKKQSDLEKQLKEKKLELEATQAECMNLTKRIKELQDIANDRAAASAREQELIQTIAELDNQLADRNKSIRVLQQRLSDMKKTLQRELKANDPGGGGGSIVTEITTNNHSIPNSRTAVLTTADDDVNFKYLKHVLIKFLTCREYEAQHLTRAVATLLRFSPEEERLLRDTLEWRKSWFGSRPRLPKTKPVLPS